jgi:hypothetical protein
VITERERSRLEDVSIPTDRMFDGALLEAALIAAQIAERGAVCNATKAFFANLAWELSKLHRWRRTWLDQVERNLEQVEAGAD